MTTQRTAHAALAAGVLCFLIGGAAVAARAIGLDSIGVEQTTTLAVFGLMLVAAGASMKRR